MEFAVRGTPTPRSVDRSIPGSARRPLSGRPPSAKPTSTRNPITGEETPIRPVSRTAASRTASRPEGVPGLDLSYMRDNADYPSKPVNVSDYPLNTPGTASTVSWGTPVGTDRSEISVRSQRTPKGSARSSRPSGVPGLTLQDEDDRRAPRKSPKPKPKEPSAWDNVPVPEDVPPPSQRHKDMYKQYQEEMKQGYQAHTHPLDFEEDDIERAVEEIKQAHPHLDIANEEDVLEKNWATAANYNKTQLMKKLDAEDMLEYNKKQKLIETVLVDQLSRAVISAPEQNLRSPATKTPLGRGRGTNRSLHDSKVRTSSTATENLLSKRVRFGARVITRNGHDAIRELTGFFFHMDNTLTIYEFRQFGKSAKALPFLNRGKYCHLFGPREGEPFALIDIYPGSTLVITSEGQHSLPETMKRERRILFRVTDVDEEEKMDLLVPDVPYSSRDEAYKRLHVSNKQEYSDKLVLKSLHNTLQKKIKKRAIKTITGLGRYYRRLVGRGSGVLYRFELEKGLFDYHIELPPETLDTVFEILDPEEKGELDYSLYMKGVIGEMNEFRKSLVTKAFRKIDTGKKGYLTLSDVKKFFNSTFQSTARRGDGNMSPLQAFLDAVLDGSSQDDISFVEFEEYYEGLCVMVDEEEDFASILRNTWTI